ncbi:isocitrate lyase/phosphoenolpyruvate mutase family protein [Microbacterium sp. ZW T5_56]|uniref:isocitrate lyase/PEP mutase family protein n=1 Tax=Microbacterium sp. ZW T5_56 TaxID=3378081 RepID=UPI0038547CEB
MATTSAGIAWSAGLADGNHLHRDLALRSLRQIAQAVGGRLPLSADLEAGYATTPDEVAVTVARAIAAGAVGINLEDGLRPIPEQVERIAAARSAAERSGIPLFINARIDTHRMGAGPDLWRRETIERAHAYTAAGADGFFVLGALAEDDVATFAAAVDAPLNVALDSGTLTVPELSRAGASRISMGSSVAEAVHRATHDIVHEVRQFGTASKTISRLSWSEINRLHSRPTPN